MKTRFCFIIISLILLGSCTTTKPVRVGYNYVEYDSYEQFTGVVIYDFESHDLDESFVYEKKDTLRIHYNLWGNNINNQPQLEIKIENLLPEPFYFDLSQSSFIINNKSNPYRTFVSENFINFIPPFSYTVLPVAPELYIEFEKDKHIFSALLKNENRRLSYLEENSPFSYRNLLTVGFDRGFNKTLTTDNKLWVSNISLANNTSAVNNTTNKAFQDCIYSDTVKRLRKEDVYEDKTTIRDGFLVFLITTSLLSTMIIVSLFL